mgnify:CR=1 FL=1
MPCTVDTSAPKHVESYEGIDYYFCCDGCRTTFLQDPAKYAAMSAIPRNAESRPGVLCLSFGVGFGSVTGDLSALIVIATFDW